MIKRHVIGPALCALLAVPVGSAAAGGEPPDEAISARHEEREVLTPESIRSLADENDQRALGDGSNLASSSMVVVLDPRFDVVDGRGDITSAAMAFSDDAQFVYGGVAVDIYANPFTDPAWTVGISGPSWHVDTTGNGSADYRI